MAALKVGEGMAALKVTELGDYLREQRHSAQLSLRQLAAVAGVSNPYLSQVERGLRKPSAEVLQQIAKGLRISAEALYVRAGILDERDDRVEVEAAILADPHLTERQRQVLLDIYATFRSQDDAGGASESAAPARSAPVTTRRTTKRSPAGTTVTDPEAPAPTGPKAKGRKTGAAKSGAGKAGAAKAGAARAGGTTAKRPKAKAGAKAPVAAPARESNVIADSTAAAAIAAITTPAPDAEIPSADTGTIHADQGA